MANTRKTVIVTGASQGIGAAVVRAFLERGYSVVGTSRNATKSAELKASDKLVLVDGDIGQAVTAQKVVDVAIQKFGSIDVLVNNAGIFSAKPFTDYSADDFRALVSTNLEGYIYITQLTIKQMLAQKSGGSVVAITSSLVENPIGGLPVSLPMITKGGLEAITRSLASEYSKEHIRFNAVAPGVVDTPLHKNNPKDFLKTLSPMGTISTPEDIASAVAYLTESRHITGEVLHVDGGAHNGKWSGQKACSRIARSAGCRTAGSFSPMLPTRLAHTSRPSSQVGCFFSAECCR
jgi:NAD(P)-dependent dehydrogenase (short-subunit alcohol dehydrogenase family)